MDSVGCKLSPQLLKVRTPSKGAPTVLTSRSEIKAVFFPNIQGLQLLGGLQETTSACRTFVKDVSSSQASIDLSPFFCFAATSYVLSQGLKALTELAVVASTHPNHNPVVYDVVSRARTGTSGKSFRSPGTTHSRLKLGHFPALCPQ